MTAEVCYTAPVRRLLLLAVLALSSCLPAPQFRRERTDPAQGALLMAVSFKGREFPYWMRHQARELFFQRIQEDGSLDPVLVPANYRVDDRLYVLNIPAGRYALTAASYFTGRARQLARLDHNFALKYLAVDVRPGELTFGGYVEIERYAGDDSSVFWLNGLRRALQYLPPFKRAVIEVIAAPQPRISHAAAVELQALRLARADLMGTFWEEAVAARLQQMGNPPEPIVEGLVRKRPVAPKTTKTFSFFDTLEWGKPHPVPGGLEWRLAKGGPAVSVVFFPAEGPGAKSLDGALAQLREIGAPEDRHALTEVRVSSRAAYAGLYTTYVYPEPALLGSQVTVLKTEFVVVPSADGFYQAQYRAEASQFPKHRAAFERFVRYIDFAPPKDKDKS